MQSPTTITEKACLAMGEQHWFQVPVPPLTVAKLGSFQELFLSALSGAWLMTSSLQMSASLFLAILQLNWLTLEEAGLISHREPGTSNAH